MEPVRWKHAVDALEPELSAALEQARNVAPTPAQLDAISARMERVLEAERLEQSARGPDIDSAPRSAQPLSVAALTPTLRRKLLTFGLVIVGLAFGGGILLGRRLKSAGPSANVAREVAHTEDRTGQAGEPATSLAYPPARVLEVAPARPRPTEQAPTPAPAVKGLAVARRRASTAGSVPAAAVSEALAATDEAGEVELLHRARRLIASDPARALSLLDEHEARFPEGVFREERSALAIEALYRTGQRLRADTLQREFRARFPSSAYLPRITQLSLPRP